MQPDFGSGLIGAICASIFALIRDFFSERRDGIDRNHACLDNWSGKYIDSRNLYDYGTRQGADFEPDKSRC